MSVIKETVQATNPGSILGVRLAIWDVMFVIIGAAIGAALGGAIYGPQTTFGAMVGMLMGPALTKIITRKRWRKSRISEKGNA